jgi:hypothetical protein
VTADTRHDPREAAWFALARDFTYTGPHDRESAHGIVAEHRPAIEAAIRDHLRPVGLEACAIAYHDWETMTTARAGFVKFDHCRRGCGASRTWKGS